MSNRSLTLTGALCALLTLAHGLGAGAQTVPPAPAQVTVPFSDPARPGTVKVNVLSGSISVKVGAARDVVVNTTPGERDRDNERQRNRAGDPQRSDDPSTAGMRRLTQPVGVNVEEENNVVTISSPAMFGPVNIAVQVPAATSLVLRTVNGGEVTVEGVTGSIEVSNVNGSIRLTDVGGPVTAHATNGKVVATLRQLAAGKPMSFTSFNGNVDVTLPASVKANLKMRSDRGDVYTDFDVQTVPAPARPNGPDARRDDNRGRDRDAADPKGKAKYRLDVDRAIYGTVNGGGPDFELRTFNGDVILRKAR
jgi:hypothetical protein